MSVVAVAALVGGLLLIAALTALIFLWAFTEALPATDAPMLYESLEPGPYTLHLTATGRRRSKVTRTVNELIGGDLGLARALVDDLPSPLVEGISAPAARLAASRLREAGAEVDVRPPLPERNDGVME